MVPNENPPSIGQQIDGLMDSLRNATQAAQASASEAKNAITLRYSTEKVVVELTEKVSKTIRQYFEENAEALGLPSTGNIGVRSDGVAVDSAATPESGRTYVASLSRETKGN